MKKDILNKYKIQYNKYYKNKIGFKKLSVEDKYLKTTVNVL